MIAIAEQGKGAGLESDGRVGGGGSKENWTFGAWHCLWTLSLYIIHEYNTNNLLKYE
jgi:hypothetical protein